MVDEINKLTPSILQHVYNANHQYKFLRENKLNLKLNEVHIIIDFSENYVCKSDKEIPAAHFGASKKQLSLHTGVFYYFFYYMDSKEKKIQCMSFDTVSDCLQHNASAIWAHLQPILKLIKSKVPNLTSIHFQSDGPTTQYKNKTNFYIFAYHCKKLKLSNATWNFTASGHRKSSSDASGGTIKR